MDVAKKDSHGGVSGGLVRDPLMPHTPSHALRADNMGMGQGMSSESESGSSSGEGESDVSDMVIDNSSKFAALSKSRRKSGESDYVPNEQGSRSPESQSESESGSDSGKPSEEEESDTSAESRSLSSKPPTGSLVRRDSDESDRSSGSSLQLSMIQRRRQKEQQLRRDVSPLIKRGQYSPFAKTNTRNILNEVAMRKHNYELCPPRRRAAQNVKYKDFYDDSEDEVDIKPTYTRQRGRRKSPSGSEFEVSEADSEESSAGESFVVSDDDDYRPTKRSGRAGGRGRRGRVRGRGNVHVIVYRWQCSPWSS